MHLMREKERKEKVDEPTIIFEDSSLLVLNKPPHWITNSADTTKDVPVVQRWLNETQTYELIGNEEFRSGIVHRLDKETSGVLLVAKTQQSFESLQLQFKERKTKKEYVALSHGIMKVKKGTVKAAIGRLPWNRERFGLVPGGRESETSYEVIGEYQKGSDPLTYVHLFPKTGRTHQLRVHLKYLGHPIVSDTFYGGRKTARRDREWCERLFLHAKVIYFAHPVTGKETRMEAPLATDLQAVLDSLTVREK